MIPSRRGKHGWHGLATLELVMVLPLLLMLLVLLLATGGVSVKQQQVTVRARHSAWQQRGTAATRAFEFDDSQQGALAATDEATVNISPLVDRYLKPSSTHHLYSGTWATSEVVGGIDLNESSPNWELHSTLARGASAGAAGQSQGLMAALGRLPSTFSSLQNSASRQVAENLGGDPESLAGQLDREQAKVQAELKRKEQQERQKARQDIQSRISTVRSELAARLVSNETREQRNRQIDRELAEETDQEAIDELKEEQTRNQQEIEATEEEIERLKEAEEHLQTALQNTYE